MLWGDYRISGPGVAVPSRGIILLMLVPLRFFTGTYRGQAGTGRGIR